MSTTTTYGQIRFLLSKELPGIDVERLDGYINDRYTAILNKIDWTRARVTTTLSTLATQSVYSLAAGAETMEDARLLAPPRVLLQKSHEELTRISPDFSQKGPPAFWAPFQDGLTTPPLAQVELLPVPDAVYGIAYWYTPDATLFGPNDTASLLPAWIDPGCLKAGVKAEMFAGVNPALAQMYEGKFKELLLEMINKQSRQIGSKKITMPSRFWRHRVNRAAKGVRSIPFLMP